ncbi:peroxidase family protein [Bosea sp. BIWAKO-01]|uniref:peroxidase family protein n=1 Tax=Bosea sp. BIWAKO-01 TaxID=506668 RepID=UPI0008682FD7|nr:peroxidase family protein [Bosea sp. BIWAKO-01]GAU86882.1 hemolysin-type calcium-binding region [Bosea sp. BIWAKO-01]
MVQFVRSDLEFILEQIRIAERNAQGENLTDILPSAQVPFGLRTVDGSFNNLAHPEFGAADLAFPRLTDPSFRPAEAGTSYADPGLVQDSQPRTISNLVVDQTANNPAAVAAAAQNPGSGTVTSPGLDGVFGTADDTPVNFIPNITPDVGLSAPFNAWMTFFGQFFDHGLDLVTKSTSQTEVVFIPLQPDDPLFSTAPGALNFMVLNRAAGGQAATNTTSPFVDQSQTYASNPSHQVFLRAYELNANGDPVATGELITNRNLGADGLFGTADDVEIGGMATWAVVKAQARDILGINLTDADVGNVPVLAVDAYGNFIVGPNGMPMVMMTDGSFTEGNRAAPISLAGAARTGHAFLNDIAHAADPTGKTADADSIVNTGPIAAGQYDNELLDAHYIAGDGRVNENIGLTAVHAVFHSEHNRLVQQTKDVALATGDVAFLNQWLDTPLAVGTTFPLTQVQIDALDWNGERLFQSAKFGTEMQYQHLVFEEFARTVQPQVDEFLAPNGYDTTINPAILAEFAHTVYRFGHSMLVETVDRFDPNFNTVGGDPQLGLIAAFLNPLAYAASGVTPEQATGAIVRGLTRQVGNEIDEFVTEAVRNNLLGLPLDLPALNIARGRDTGIPSLNQARVEFYQMTGDSQLKPYISWTDFAGHLKHTESLINFIAAYGTHASITDATTMADKRAAASLLVLGGVGAPADRLDFLNATGAFTGGSLGGLNDVDFWLGGLAEEKMPFGGMLGSTFNFVFETQLESLQNGDRFYYLSRTAGMNFGTELENNSFAKLVMLNSDATHLPNAIFTTPTFTLEVNRAAQHTGLGLDGRADPTGGIEINGVEVVPLVIRDNPATPGTDTNYLQYTGEDHVVLGGTAGNDVIISGDGDDTLYGDGGNDRLEGGYGNDTIMGGDGDDIIRDLGGDDRLEGGAGNDVIHAGNMMVGGVGNLILGGAGKDYIVTMEDISTTFGGQGDDFIYSAKTSLPPTGNEGDDWIEKGTQDGAPGDNFAPLLADNVIGNDIFIGGGGFDEFIGEGGDDIFVGSDAQDKMDGMSGFDWVTYKNDRQGVTVDLTLAALAQPHGETPAANTGVVQPVGASPASILDRFAEVEGLSGSRFADILRGDNVDAVTILNHGGATGGALTNVALIDGLQGLLLQAGLSATGFATGNIMLGGAGSDLLEGRGGDDLIDGDRWLNVRISVRANIDGTGAEIATFDSMVAPTLLQNMLNGVWNPGQLVAVRELRDDDNAFDTAIFSGASTDYTVTTTNGITTVTDNVGTDGTDTLVNVERLQFSDVSVTLPNGAGLNLNPTGQLAIQDATSSAADNTPTSGQMLRVSIGTVTDGDTSAAAPNGILPGSISYLWQVETAPASGIFEDIILLPLGDLAFQSADGTTFRVTPDLVGASLRVKAIFTDGHGVTETVFSAPTQPVAAGAPVPPPVAPTPVVDATAGGEGIMLVRSDLNFILDQIKIAEANAAGTPLTSLLPNVRVPLGLRTVDGSGNNLGTQQQSETFGAADNVFPRVTNPVFNSAEGGTSYQQTSGLVIDSQPRTISNLIVDQTMNNPAAIAAALRNAGSENIAADTTALLNVLQALNTAKAGGDPVAVATAQLAFDGTVDRLGLTIVTSPGLDGQFGTADDKQVFEIPNIAPDAGLSAPFNAWMTFFGQFFDHGLDLVTKGGSGTVFIPLQPDDPLFVPGSPTNFMVLTRATNQPGPDGVLGTADDIHEHTNTTTPFVDQNQTYSSHPSHQVFLRAYELNAAGDPVATGGLITNRDLGADGKFGTADDTEIGGMATWKVVKAQARDILGINLTDADIDSGPLLATDAYGNFMKGPNGFPQVVIRVNNGPDGIAGNADDVTTLVEGNPAAPISLANAVRTGHAFLNDIAHNAVPVFNAGVLAPDADVLTGNAVPVGPGGNNLAYDNELLDAHYIAGDGRVNENIGLTTVHAIFHSEHNRLVEQTKNTVLTSGDLAFLTEWLMPGTAPAAFPTDAAAIANLQWNGERLFQTAKFGTEMQYQHLVFEEFARTIQPNVDLFFAPTQVYDVDLDPSIVAEFAHTVYRFGHSMLTETVDRFTADFNVVSSDPNNPDQQIGLIAAFLNPLAFAASGPTPEEATSAIVRGVTRQAGNEIDEFVTEALRNNLLGLPLDLPTINLARGRDVGIPSLNEVRRQIYTQTGEVQLKPYTSWVDLIQSLKHADSVINFIAAYGLHPLITAATTLADKRAAASLLVLGGVGEPADRLDFLNGTGAWASAADGATITGVDDIDLWIGGLAEEKMPFGGMLGSTFNFIFENQLEKLQDGDRFYYLERTAGLSFNAELESNSFAKLIMANTDATHLPGVVFTAPGFTLEVNQAAQHTGLGADGRADPFEPVAAFGDLSLALAQFAPGAGGWVSEDRYPRHLADVNGDGRADIVGFGEHGVWVSLANADGTFQPLNFALAQFSPSAGGWVSDDRYPRHLADVNGDGRADIVGFGEHGVWVSRANADGTFQPLSFELTQFAPSAGGWVSQDRYPRHLADVNGDGRADVVGFGEHGVWVSLANADGTFQPLSFALTQFAPSAGGWVSDDRYPRQLADVNGDGRADIVGFGEHGVWVSLANADGTFQPLSFALAQFAPSAGGWTSQSLYPRQVVDVNGDGLADIVGFGPAGVQVALGNADGTFQAPTFELHAFSTIEGGWSNQNTYPRELADVNGDGLADIVGFGEQGVSVALGQQGGPVVTRDNPETVGPDTNFLHYTGEEHVVLGGTAGDDIIMSGDGDDTLWGDAGNDRLDGGAGNDQLRGGTGDDIITDTGGDDNIQGGDGNDVLHGGNGVNLIIGGFGSDFIVTGEDASEAIGGQGNDFILGSKANEQDMGNEGDDWIEKGTSDGAPGDNFDPLGNDPVIGNDVFIGDGENDKFNGEGGDDIMAGKTGFGDRYIGGSGYDWAIYKPNTTGVTIDISDRFFDQPPVPGGSTSLSRFDFVEGLSGSDFGDVLNGDDSDATTLPTAGATGSVLTNIDLIAGLRDLLPAGATFFDGGNIILGGAGSDIIQGRGGNDIIDGDRYLNVRISVRANIDGTGPEIASFDSMEPMVPFMLNGTYNPGQLVIVREILTSATADFDTAKFSGLQANYTITTNADGSVTVTDNVGTDGTDTLRNIERLEFADQSVVLGGANSEPVGLPAIVDANGGVIAVGDVLTVDLAGLTDADNPGGTVPAFPVSYFWQVDNGNGTFDDILTFGAGEVERAHGPSFTVTDAESDLALRLRVVYQDANGVLEEVFSAPTAAVVAPTIITGTAGADTLLGTAGPDIISAGAGDDTITLSATGDSDIIDGGAGTDTLDLSAIIANLTVDLGTGLLGRGSAVSTQTGTDTLWSIENVATGAGNDTITASNAVNVIQGGAGDDTFRFLSKEAADGDTILDFQPGDKLDLSGIDANGALAGNQSFTLTSGPAFTATAQLVVAHETRADGDYTVVKGNVDGDADADFQINLKGNHTLTGGNFSL